MGLKIGAEGGKTQTAEDPFDLAGRGGGNGRRREAIERMGRGRLFGLVLTVTVVFGNILGCTCVLRVAVRGGDGGVGLGLGLGVVHYSHIWSETIGRKDSVPTRTNMLTSMTKNFLFAILALGAGEGRAASGRVLMGAEAGMVRNDGSYGISVRLL